MEGSIVLRGGQRKRLLQLYRLLRSRAGGGFAPPSSQGLLAAHRFCARTFRARSGPTRSAQTPSIPRLSNDIPAVLPRQASRAMKLLVR